MKENANLGTKELRSQRTESQGRNYVGQESSVTFVIMPHEENCCWGRAK